MTTITERLDYLRGEIEAERISYGEIVELQSLAEHISDDDVVLRQWVDLPEDDQPEYCTCGEQLDQDCHGNARCPQCDCSCPCCDDGGGPSLAENNETEYDEDDYTLTPSGLLGCRVSVSSGGKHLGEYADTHEALAAVKADMESSLHWPNIWWVSDHGNGWQINLDGVEI